MFEFLEKTVSSVGHHFRSAEWLVDQRNQGRQIPCSGRSRRQMTRKTLKIGFQLWKKCVYVVLWDSFGRWSSNIVGSGVTRPMSAWALKNAIQIYLFLTDFIVYIRVENWINLLIWLTTSVHMFLSPGWFEQTTADEVGQKKVRC